MMKEYSNGDLRDENVLIIKNKDVQNNSDSICVTDFMK